MRAREQKHRESGVNKGLERSEIWITCARSLSTTTVVMQIKQSDLRVPAEIELLEQKTLCLSSGRDPQCGRGQQKEFPCPNVSGMGVAWTLPVPELNPSVDLGGPLLQFCAGMGISPSLYASRFLRKHERIPEGV